MQHFKVYSVWKFFKAVWIHVHQWLQGFILNQIELYPHVYLKSKLIYLNINRICNYVCMYVYRWFLITSSKDYKLLGVIIGETSNTLFIFRNFYAWGIYPHTPPHTYTINLLVKFKVFFDRSFFVIVILS